MIHYEIEVLNPHTKSWVREKHERHTSIHAASTAAAQVRRIAKRDTRIVEVTVEERIIHDPCKSAA